MMKRDVGKETAELLGVFVNKIAPFWGSKCNRSESIKQVMPQMLQKLGSKNCERSFR